MSRMREHRDLFEVKFMLPENFIGRIENFLVHSTIFLSSITKKACIYAGDMVYYCTRLAKKGARAIDA